MQDLVLRRFRIYSEGTHPVQRRNEENNPQEGGKKQWSAGVEGFECKSSVCFRGLIHMIVKGFLIL